jgi:hypothetical protein
MRIENRTQTAGAVMRPGDRKPRPGGCPMGLEPPPRTGACAFADSAARHRVCSCYPRTECPGCHTSDFICSCLWVWLTYDCHPPRKTGRFTGQVFLPQPDGTLRCPAGQELRAHERRREGDGSLRVVYAASIRACRPCPLRDQCQWNGTATAKPRQVSVLLHPLTVGNTPLRLRVTGDEENTDAPVYSLFSINVSR